MDCVRTIDVPVQALICRQCTYGPGGSPNGQGDVDYAVTDIGLSGQAGGEGITVGVDVTLRCDEVARGEVRVTAEFGAPCTDCGNELTHEQLLTIPRIYMAENVTCANGHGLRPDFPRSVQLFDSPETGTMLEVAGTWICDDCNEALRGKATVPIGVDLVSTPDIGVDITSGFVPLWSSSR